MGRTRGISVSTFTVYEVNMPRGHCEKVVYILRFLFLEIFEIPFAMTLPQMWVIVAEPAH